MAVMPFGGRIGAPIPREYGVTPRFSGIWTPDDAAAYTTDGTWPTGVSDVTYSNVAFHTHCDGLVGSIPYNHCGRGSTVGSSVIATPAVLSPTQVKFGRTALALPFAGGIYSPSHAHYAAGTGDLCVRFWTYVTSIPANSSFFDSGVSTWQVYCKTTGVLAFFAAAADRILSSAGAITLNTWHYIELSRVSGTMRMFLSGAQVGSNYTDTNNYPQNAIAFGSAANGTGPMSGYMDEMQLIIGQGVNTANYSVPTAPFADQ